MAGRCRSAIFGLSQPPARRGEGVKDLEQIAARLYWWGGSPRIDSRAEGFPRNERTPRAPFAMRKGW